MTFISYAQNYEDVMLWRALQDVGKGFYIDVGACDPVMDSVSKAFYDAGWRGINIEPVEFWHKKNQHGRPEDINLRLAMGARQTEADFFELVGSGLSTMDETFARRAGAEHGFEVRQYPVPVETLSAICEQYKPPEIHFLKIDVEGAEVSVLQGADFTRNRPWIILVEATNPDSQVENHQEWEQYLVEQQYHFVYFDGLNRFYIADEHKDLDRAFELPPHYFDFFKRASEYYLEGREQLLQKELVSVRQLYVEQQEILVKLEDDKLHTEWLEKEWKRAKKQIDLLQQEVVFLQSQSDAGKQQAAQSKMGIVTAQQRFEKLQKIYHADQAVITHLRMNLQAVYGSWSWKITWPLRKITKPLFEFFPFFKRSEQSLLMSAMDFVLARERLSACLLKMVNRYPAVKAYLLQVAQENRLVEIPVSRQTAEEQQESAVGIPRVSARTAHIYSELQKARQERNS